MALIDKLPAYIERVPGGGVLLTKIDQLFNWSRLSSIWYLMFATACCAIEMMADMTSPYDFDRYGMIPRGTPRQSDLMIVAGTVNYKMGSRVRRLWEQMPDPKYVISMGSCANVGGPFHRGYSVMKGVDLVIPVDVYVPGCPPRPEAVMEGVLQLQEKIRKASINKDKELLQS